MENTVTISLKEYDELRDFQNKTLAGKKFSIKYSIFHTLYQEFYTDNEIIEDLTEKIKKYEENISKLKSEIKECESKTANDILLGLKHINEKAKKKKFFWSK